MDDSLDLQITYRTILDAARQGKYVTYGALVKANGAKWQKARYKLNSQLGELMELAAQRDWPLPSSIVVDRANHKTGTLSGRALKGFAGTARGLGFDIQDPRAFVKEQQQRMFAWAVEAPDELGLPVDETNDKPQAGGPKYVQYFGPVLDALRKLGGAGEPKAVSAIVAELAGVTATELQEKNKNGKSKYENHVAWARFYLSKAGLIDGGVHGKWVLTAKGRETQLDRESAAELYRDVSTSLRDQGSREYDDVRAPPEDVSEDLFADPNRSFWFVGTLWDNGDQSERFINEGIWQNGHQTRFSEHVGRMKPGDRVAIKAAFTKKYGLPFKNYGKSVSCMRIKAIGTVTEGTKDGRTVKVDWTPLDKPKEWYFYTYRLTIVEADASDGLARRLIQFAFGDHSQDYGFWLAKPYWAKRYVPSTTISDDEGGWGKMCVNVGWACDPVQ